MPFTGQLILPVAVVCQMTFTKVTKFPHSQLDRYITSSHDNGKSFEKKFVPKIKV